MADLDEHDASGSTFGPGYVYIFVDKSGWKIQYKIGMTTRTVEERLDEIRRTNPNAKIMLDNSFFEAAEANGAETAAQKAVQEELGMVKVARNATDWFYNPQEASEEYIRDVVDRAVALHNDMKYQAAWGLWQNKFELKKL